MRGVPCAPPMIERQDFGEVVKVKMARDIPGPIQYHTSCYWVDGLLIDTGCAHCSPEFGRTIRELPLSQVVNTHCHEDHIGNNRQCQARGAAIQAHALALPYLADPLALKLHPYRHVFWGTPPPSTGRPIADTIVTERHRLQVIPTPGHSRDHIALYEPTMGWLFTGDAYVGGRDRALRAGFNIHQIIASLKKLSELPTARIFPASGSVVSDPAAALASKIAYLEETGEKVLALHAKGRSASQIRDALFGREMTIAYVTLGNFSGLNLVRSYLAGIPA
jgi:glyoxylase-like metal-dependent hydrolase (beta-lactamase superfamily II)